VRFVNQSGLDDCGLFAMAVTERLLRKVSIAGIRKDSSSSRSRRFVLFVRSPCPISLTSPVCVG
jgi:hypothetical protein